MKVCSRCLIEKSLDDFGNRKRSRDGKQAWCRQCLSEYRKANPRTVEYHRRYYERHGKRDREAVRARRQSDPEYAQRRRDIANASYHRNSTPERRAELAARSAQWRIDNPEKALEVQRSYRARNLDLCRQRCRDNQKKNPLYFRQAAMRYRARKRNASTGPVDYAAILERDALQCHLCFEWCDPDEVHFDHVVPLSKGGAHTENNIRVAHAACNLRKGNKILSSGAFSSEPDPPRNE